MQERSSYVRKRLRGLKSLERELEVRLKKLYIDSVGHELVAVTCKFLDSSDLYILMEGVRSLPENFLEEWGSSEIATEMRSAINQIIKKRLNSTLESELSIKASHISLLKPNRAEQLSFLVSLSL